MLFINNRHRISDEDDDLLDVMLLHMPFYVVFEEPYLLKGDYSIHETTTILSKEIIKGGEKLFIDDSADYYFQ